jgi:hypothetical protein
VTRLRSVQVRKLDVVVPGLYAWWATVIGPLPLESTPRSLWWIAAGAVVCLLAGSWSWERWPRLARWLGISGFVFGCVLVWGAMPAPFAPRRLDPWMATMGSVAWALFAMGWGTSELPLDATADAALTRDEAGGAAAAAKVAATPVAEPVQHVATRKAVLLVVLAVTGALAVIATAWRTQERERGLLVHVVAICAAVALVTTAGKVACAWIAPRAGSQGDRRRGAGRATVPPVLGR